VNLLVAALMGAEVNHVTGDISYVGLLLPRRRTVQTILDCGPLQRETGFRRWLLLKVWFEYPVRRCAHVTVISEATRENLLRNVRCDSAKVSVIPVAIAEGFARVDRVFDAIHPRILQVGTAPNKNVHRLVRALAGTECRLEVIGARDPEAERMLVAQGTPFRWRSGLAPSDVIRAYVESDIVSLASTLEGFGMPILEAQSVGRPVLTSLLPPMDSVSGGAASFVDPLDVDSIRRGIRRLIDDTPYREDLVTRGFENVKRFDPQRIAGQYLDVYRRVVAGKDQGR
jgi:glycosyltransferase involved in cell wall biosynthesis